MKIDYAHVGMCAHTYTQGKRLRAYSKTSHKRKHQKHQIKNKPKEQKSNNISSTRYRKVTRDSQRQFKTINWQLTKGDKDNLYIRARQHRLEASAVGVYSRMKVKITLKVKTK